MPDTQPDAAALLRRFAEVRGLPAEDVRFLRRALALARRERSAALLRRVVVPLAAEKRKLECQLSYLLDRNEALGAAVRRAGRA